MDEIKIKEDYCNEIIQKNYGKMLQPWSVEDFEKTITSIKRGSDSARKNLKIKTLSASCDIAKRLYCDGKITGNFEDILQDAALFSLNIDIDKNLYTYRNSFFTYFNYIRLTITGNLLRKQVKMQRHNRDLGFIKNKGIVVSYNTVNEKFSSPNNTEKETITHDLIKDTHKCLSELSKDESAILYNYLGNKIPLKDMAESLNVPYKKIFGTYMKGLRKFKRPINKFNLTPYTKD